MSDCNKFHKKQNKKKRKYLTQLPQYFGWKGIFVESYNEFITGHTVHSPKFHFRLQLCSFHTSSYIKFYTYLSLFLFPKAIYFHNLIFRKHLLFSFMSRLFAHLLLYKETLMKITQYNACVQNNKLFCVFVALWS